MSHKEDEREKERKTALITNLLAQSSSNYLLIFICNYVLVSYSDLYVLPSVFAKRYSHFDHNILLEMCHLIEF